MAADRRERWAQSPHLPPFAVSARADRGRAPHERVGVPARPRMRRARSGRSSSSCSQLREAGVLDEVVVVDAASERRHRRARGRGRRERPPGGRADARATGPVLGKGDAMWRALSVLEGELVCFLDADTEDFSAHFATGLLGPLVLRARGVDLSRPSTGARSRPRARGRRRGRRAGQPPDGPARAGRTSTPSSRAFASRWRARSRRARELLERLPFATGYGVEIAMLIDVCDEVGLEGWRRSTSRAPQPRTSRWPRWSRWRTTVLATVARRLERGRAGSPRRPPRAPSSARRWRASRSLRVSAHALPLPRPRRHPARHAAPRCCTTARARSRSTACARCRRACAPAWRSC